jgi:hypothetical protein
MSVRWLWLTISVLLCAGCASLTPAEEESLAEAQAFADATARAYRFAPVQVVVSDSDVAWPGVRLIRVTPQTLRAPLPVRDLSIALLLAFQIVNPPTATSEAHYVEINRTVYPERNIAAVDILARVKGLPTRTAVDEVYVYLAGQARSAAETSLSQSQRVPQPCEQIDAFIRHYPDYRLGRTSWCP